jgi:malonate decarboxylase beta subunit
MSTLMKPHEADWYEASARERIAGLLDPGTFTEFIAPTERAMSPHLPQFDLTGAFDDGVVVGRGLLGSQKVYVAAQEGRFLGGAFGEVHGGKVVGLLRAAVAKNAGVKAVLLMLDTGGVRLQEANAGELAISEIINAIIAARLAGIAVVALIGGRAGAFGGGSIITACCSRIAISEQGRTSVSGPEVIETNKGVEEFDSKDRALVWRVTGGRTRALMGGADLYVKKRVQDYREAAIALVKCGFLRLRTGIPIDRGQSFQSIADSIPMIADSSPIDGF